MFYRNTSQSGGAQQRLFAILFGLFLIASSSITQASITGFSYDGQSGKIAASNSVFDATSATATWDEHQWGNGNGQLVGSGTLNNTDDPVLTLENNTTNDTSFAWTFYNVAVIMDRSFTISGATNDVPGDWFVIVTQPTAIGGGNYQGNIEFDAGTPVTTGNVFDYIYKVTFGGGPQFSLTEIVTVPEPKPMGFVMGGMVMLGIYQGWFRVRRNKLAKKAS